MIVVNFFAPFVQMAVDFIIHYLAQVSLLIRTLQG